MTITVMEPIGELALSGERLEMIYRRFEVDVPDGQLPMQIARWYDGGIKQRSMILHSLGSIRGMMLAHAAYGGSPKHAAWANMAERALYIAEACHRLDPSRYPPVTISIPTRCGDIPLTTDPHAYPGWRVPTPEEAVA